MGGWELIELYDSENETNEGFRYSTSSTPFDNVAIWIVAESSFTPCPDANPAGVGVGEPAGFSYIFWDAEW